MTVLGWLAACVLSASARAETDPKVKVNGDVKSFFVGTFPYDHSLFESVGLMPVDPMAQGTLDGRLKVAASFGKTRVLVHHAVTAQTGGTVFSAGQTGLGVQSPQLIDLGWSGVEDPESSDAMTLLGRTDRLSVSTDVGPVTLTAGRQPITLGHGLSFTPMDLVNPFFPTVVDQEYKPGVDALTADVFFGTSTQFSLMTAYTHPQPVSDAEDWAVDGMVYAFYGQHTFGRHDVGVLVGEVQGDEVVGLTVATYAGPVGLHADATYTMPHDDDDPFVRGVMGALWSITGDLTVSSEVYHQSLGASDPADYLNQLSDDRYARGELWLAGTTYGSLAVSQQITPLVMATASAIANLGDGSALVAPNATVSVSDEVQLVVGGFVGLGDRPAVVDAMDLLDPETGLPLPTETLNQSLGIRSEFGMYPSNAYVQMKAYF